MLRIVLYLASIVAANVLTASTQPIVFWWFVIPMGTFFIGLTFVLRDLVQIRYGREISYLMIIVAFLLSGITSYLLGDPLNIVFASVITFLLSESADTEIFTRIKYSIQKRVFISGLIGGFIDSTAFVIIGLSPFGAGFIPWEVVPAAVLSQVIVKTIVQYIGAKVIERW